MLFTGTAGLGKTTVAKAICEQLQLDYIVINGSEEGNIDTLRGKIKQFASSISLQGGYKVVILDEADYLGGTINSEKHFVVSSKSFLRTVDLFSHVILRIV